MHKINSNTNIDYVEVFVVNWFYLLSIIMTRKIYAKTRHIILFLIPP